MSIPGTMHAWRKHKGNPVPVWEEVPVPSIPPTGLLVKLLASGVCHSDQALLDVEDRPHFNDVYILGHEGCGEIVAIGSEVTDNRFKIGGKVALLAVPGCGLDTCSECSRDLSQLCPAGMHHGIGQDGFYAEFVGIDVRGAVPLPDGVPPEVGAIATDAVTTAYHGIIRRAQVQPHESVFLFGLGGLGFNALQIVHKHIGARVIVSDLRPEKLAAAKELGIPESDIVPPGTSVTEFVAERGVKIDTVLEFVGKHQTFADAQRIVRPGGKVLCIGTLDRVNELDMKNGIRKRLSFVFSYGGQYRDLVDVLNLIVQGVINPRVKTGRLEEFPRVLKELCQGEVEDRVALVP
ncbi:chaperonin 10-like protein [Aspergillus transmontanensis]|uniref:Chaperonin 10-like protein n=1 Tax=Aspergillus transmontanensis TaxID=1034304 RepID=A0A5N6VPQ9_9EURO|nr:chaperonin 10-like protein [Aspergillus transmontanensis]